jgi:hypothetical protein
MFNGERNACEVGSVCTNIQTKIMKIEVENYI